MNFIEVKYKIKYFDLAIYDYFMKRKEMKEKEKLDRILTKI